MDLGLESPNRRRLGEGDLERERERDLVSGLRGERPFFGEPGFLWDVPKALDAT